MYSKFFLSCLHQGEKACVHVYSYSSTSCSISFYIFIPILIWVNEDRLGEAEVCSVSMLAAEVNTELN